MKSIQAKIFSWGLGFLSIISQVILLRELTTVFYGNESAYAIVLGSWLFWVATGSFCASRFIHRVKNPLRWLGVCQGILFVLLLGTLVLIRGMNPLMGIHIGEIVGFTLMGGLTFIVLAPVTFCFGGIYVLLCHWPGVAQEDRGEDPVSLIYRGESLGSACGGILFSFILIRFFSAMQILFWTGGISFVTVLWFLFSGRAKARRILPVLVIVILLGGMALQISRLDQWSYEVQWKGLDLIAVEDSEYGNIAVTRMDQEYSLFENGLLSFSTRDVFAGEEMVHYSLLSHPDPRNVLLIGNGLDGSLREILKYPGVTIDYVQLDPRVITVAQRFFPAAHLQCLEDPRINIFYEDARFFVKQKKKRYDVVLVNLADPFTAVLNRYYSKDFFEEVKADLNPDGLIALRVSSSENYLSDENQRYLRSMHSTLKTAFAYVQSIPGDTNLFLASNANIVLRDAGELIRRIEARGVKTQYVDQYSIPYKISADRIAYIDSVFQEEGRINTDSNPIAYFYDIVLWSTHFNTVYKKVIETLLRMDLRILWLIPLAVFGVGVIFFRTKASLPIAFSIFSTGFSEIVFQLIVIISFQTLYGYAYYRIGLIIASFMLGLVGGSVFIGKRPGAQSSCMSMYCKTQLGIAIYPLILIGAYSFFHRHAGSLGVQNVLSLVYTFLPLMAGFMGGIQYPLAAKIISSRKSTRKSVSQIAGFLYAADVWGASFGAIISAAFLIPLMGIHAMAVFISLLNFSVFLWLVCLRREE